MKASTVVVLSFVGMIALAASLVIVPLPGPPGREESRTVNQTSAASAAGTTPVVPKIEPASVAESTAGTDLPQHDEPASLVQTASGSTAIPDEVDATEPSNPQNPKDVASENAGIAPPATRPIRFREWPKPAVALIVTGEQHGYFEPCGCTANQLGGMSRRAALFDMVRGLGWATRGIDLGGISRRTGIQAQQKFEITLEALRDLQYVVLGMGVEELRLGPDYLLAQHLTEGDEPLRFLGSNLVFFGAKELGTPLPHAVIEIEGLKIGISCVMSETIRKDVIPEMTAEEAAAAELQFTDPQPALTEVLQHFEQEAVEFRILISHATLEESRALAREFPQWNLVLAANGFGDGEPAPEMIGPVRMLQVGENGKSAGVLALYPDDTVEPVRFELVTLDGTRFADTPRMTALMQKYQDRLLEESVVTSSEPAIHGSGAKFIGADRCGECHTTAYAIWKETPHSHAFESLDPVHRRKGHERLHGVNRSFDPECLSCHVTGWNPKEYFRFDSGFLNEKFAATDEERKLQSLLAGNQCENCHGPGSRHVELIDAGDLEAAAREVRVTLDQARDEASGKSCRECHDLDNSPEFDFDSYWEKVKHYGRD
jgi:hypothetical protein